MSMVVAACVGLVIYGMIRVLNLTSPSLPPSILSKSQTSDFIQAILASCPILKEPYIPPLLWGKSGHVQTIVYGKVGRRIESVPVGVRHSKTLDDGSTLTYDLYEPTGVHSVGDFCMLVCPGFGSSSESSYIQTLVTCALACGYRAAVLNHLGCLRSLKLTAPRIFSYGGWDEFHIMRQEVERRFPNCKLIMVGLSMGANIVLKYLGENLRHQQDVWCAVSLCQGYNINEAKILLKMWENLRRLYLSTMTMNQIRLVKRHSDILFTEEMRQKFGLDLEKIFSATTLEDLDRHFTCKVQGYQDVVEYYERCSCSNFITNIDIPLVLLNSEDDPIVPAPLLKHARQHVEKHECSFLVTTKHGGHLGYYESGLVRPQRMSWMDRFVCQVTDAVVHYMVAKHLGSSYQSSLRLSLQAKKLLSARPQIMPWDSGDMTLDNVKASNFSNKTGSDSWAQKAGTQPRVQKPSTVASPQKSGTNSRAEKDGTVALAQKSETGTLAQKSGTQACSQISETGVMAQKPVTVAEEKGKEYYKEGEFAAGDGETAFETVPSAWDITPKRNENLQTEAAIQRGGGEGGVVEKLTEEAYLDGESVRKRNVLSGHLDDECISAVSSSDGVQNQNSVSVVGSCLDDQQKNGGDTSSQNVTTNIHSSFMGGVVVADISSQNVTADVRGFVGGVVDRENGFEIKNGESKLGESFGTVTNSTDGFGGSKEAEGNADTFQNGGKVEIPATRLHQYLEPR